MDTQTAVFELLEPIVGTIDVELIDVEWTGGTLRVTVDEPGGISTAKVVEVNRLISPVLDQHDPIAGRYTLEVSSPGVERALRRPSHYQRAIGEQVLVKLMGTGGSTAEVSTMRRIRGNLVSADEAAIVVEASEIDGVDLDTREQHEIEMARISKAKTVFDWGPAPKPGKSKKNGSKKSKSNTNMSSTKTTKEVDNGK